MDTYFPPLVGDVECRRCDRKTCMSRDRYQRDRRDFSVTAGRCPRLPNYLGFVDSEDRELYEGTFPLIRAERDEGGRISLTLTGPGLGRPRKVNYVRGCWYIRDKDPDGAPARRAVTIDGYIDSPGQIERYMDSERAKRCLFRCTIEDYYI